MRVLALDTATQRCSAALWLEGTVSARAAVQSRGHGELILPMIDELLAASALTLAALDAIAFGRGPGAFTGLRLAASVAQGLAFGAGLPVLPVSDLAAVAQQALDEADPAVSHVLVCQDARMGEVYWGAFEGAGGMACACLPEQVGAPAEVSVDALRWPATSPVTLPASLPMPVLRQDWIGAGSGFEAYPQLHAYWRPLLRQIRADLLPDAAAIARLAAQAGLAAALPPQAAQPVYLRDRVAVVPPPIAVAPSRK